MSDIQICKISIILKLDLGNIRMDILANIRFSNKLKTGKSLPPYYRMKLSLGTSSNKNPYIGSKKS
jgi:hypothetical protein